MLDEGVQVFGGIRIAGRSENASVAQRARAELHSPLHPRHDAVLLQQLHGGSDEFWHGGQQTEAQLAVFEYLLDLGRREGRSKKVAEVPDARAARGFVPDVERGSEG